jgi:hypothetical protein
MVPNRYAAELKKLLVRREWLLSQAAEYESGRPTMGIENGIVAAMKGAEMAAMFRKQAADLSVFISAYENPEA